MKIIFEPIDLGALKLKNRILRSAVLTDKDGENGRILPYQRDSAMQLAENDVAAIITGMMGVGVNSCVTDFMTRIYLESFAEEFGKVSDAVHAKGGKIIPQIAHAGAQSMFLEEGTDAWAPSDCVSMMGFEAKEMTKEQIKRVVKDFGSAALICKNAGADAVQIHGAHAYLLSQFLSPYYNKRCDEYGGSIENRARLTLEVYDEVRRAVGEGYPVMIKINFDDLIGEEGLCGEDCIWVCKQLDQRGIDAIEVSSGLSLTKESRPMQKYVEGSAEGFFTQGALKVAQAVKCAVISVGGYRNQEQILHCLNLGDIAAVALCRPLSNPQYMEDWDRG